MCGMRVELVNVISCGHSHGMCVYLHGWSSCKLMSFCYIRMCNLGLCGQCSTSVSPKGTVLFTELEILSSKYRHML